MLEIRRLFSALSTPILILLPTVGVGPVTRADECGFADPARPVPQNRPAMPAGSSLWPRNSAGEVTFRPATDGSGQPLSIPGQRDSTEYRALGFQIPNAEWGLELFTDVAAVDGNDDWLFTSYNVGLQAWDLRASPGQPTRAAYRDGWMGDFQSMPPAGEVELFVESIDAIRNDGRFFVGLAGRSGHGFSFWEFTPPNQFVQHCQLETLNALQVELGESDGRAYAFVGAGDGLWVVDLEASLDSGAGCTVTGRVGEDGGYVSILEKDDKLFAAVADGSGLVADPLGVALWELNPEDPSASRLLFSGFHTQSRGVALFDMPNAAGRYFLGFVENRQTIEFYDVSACLEHVGSGTCGGLGSPLAVQDVRDIGKLYEFLDISQSSDGRTWAYYGFVTSPGLFGEKFEYLLDVTPLAGIDPATAEDQGPLALAEATDGGDTYANSAPCTNTAPIDYWGDYYPLSRYGLSFMTPRHGTFINDKFYRAAFTFLDIHEVAASTQGSVSTAVDGVEQTFWLDETVTMNATAEGPCSPAAGSWCWSVATAGAGGDLWSHSPDLGDCSAAYANPESFDFSCTPAGARCADGTATLSAWSTSCGVFPPGPSQINEVVLTLKDPAVDIEGLETGGAVFEQCRTVDLDAQVRGRGPVTWRWLIDGEAVGGCSGSAGPVDLAGVDVSCPWDTSGVDPGLIFIDGFESGDTSRWDAPLRSGSVVGPTVDLEARLVVTQGVVDVAEAAVLTIEEIGDPAFADPDQPTSSTPSGGSATLVAEGTGTSVWTWEIEDPDQGVGPCTFDAGASCLVLQTAVGTVQHTWLSSGSFAYRVTLGNCRSAETASAQGAATVVPWTGSL